MELIYEQILKLVLAVILGGFVGWEREKSHKPAGIRTHVLVCIGAALIVLTSVSFFPDDSSRIVAGVLTGIGFLGAGTIIAARGDVHGLTTAATLWLVAIIGATIGLNNYILAVVVTALVFIILKIKPIEKEIISRK